MIIDLILDRKEDKAYNVKTFYNDVVAYGEIGHGITYAMDYGAEKDVKNALKQYLIDNDYNLEIGLYIDSVEWLKNSDFEKSDYFTFRNYTIEYWKGAVVGGENWVRVIKDNDEIFNDGTDLSALKILKEIMIHEGLANFYYACNSDYEDIYYNSYGYSDDYMKEFIHDDFMQVTKRSFDTLERVGTI